MKRLTSERAVRRYLQIAAIEVTVEKLETAIETVQREIDSAEDRLKELRSSKSELLKAMRDAAKDEGQLPLFDNLTAELVDLGVPAELLPPTSPMLTDASL
jgi:chromosome segregation ATPase